MPLAPKPQDRLPVRLTPRKPTDKAIQAARRKGPMSTGRPIPTHAELSALYKKILDHADPTKYKTLGLHLKNVAYYEEIIQKHPPASSASPDIYETSLAKSREQVARLLPREPFPKDAWEDLLAQPDESILILAIKDFGHPMYIAHMLEHNLASPLLYRPEDYPRLYQKEFSDLWSDIVERVFTLAASASLEFTPLQDALWCARDSTKYSFQNATLPDFLTKNRPAALNCPTSKKILENSTDRLLLDKALRFKSHPWRDMAIRSSASLSDPAVLLDILPHLDEDLAVALPSNIFLSPDSVDILYEWVIYNISKSELGFSQEIIEGLARANKPLQESHFKRILAILRFQNNEDFRRLLSYIPSIAGHPLILPELLQSRDPSVLENLLQFTKGPAWLAVLSHISSFPSSSHSVLILLKRAKSSQLQGLTRTSLLPWLQHADKSIRLATISLVQFLPSGLAPEVPPLPKPRPKRR